MASPVIPKESLTAYQRWELLGFDESPAAKPAAAEEKLPMALPTAEELERMHQQAAQEGFKIGHEEGYKVGYEAGRAAAAAVAAQLAALADALDQEGVRQDEAIAAELLDLALAVARQMVRTSLRVKQGMIQEIVREAMTALPSLTGHLRILAHPDDVEPLREFMETEHAHFSFKVVADSRIERGGFRIESSHSEVDARLPVRWREIVDCLGSDAEWLE
ncbi:flagellar assembly protein FliH [Parasulfuritortus cantonensis]|uniref:Flagellar assembly protein FliH n=1 Tax=Parasulfuritortus cantonensis TaxID=2528202 RepID=A0A4R1BGK0_9PROT|nr:FliH/SctL family protein [Parasulfuritortus cantonensis]TCJ16287.1 flagellar assembly protein FliH [Parasulfuritortus cantonensis]